MCLLVTDTEIHYLYSYSFYTRGWEEGDEMNRVSSYQSEVRINRIMTIIKLIIDDNINNKYLLYLYLL